MKKYNLEGLDLELYHEELDNGLNIYVIPKNDVNNIYTTLSTKYGSIHNTFVPIGKKKEITVNDGIAHFLEHKMFEQPDGLDPFTVFARNGTDANANTSNYKTTYLFSGPDYFKENINYLLDFVQTPYFTGENVEKEKGIIGEEIKMYQDQPYARLYEISLYNAFNTHPIKHSIAGSIESINKITKEELYECYNTFYHPSNMFLIITGNVLPEEAINLIKDNQANKDYTKMNLIKPKKILEKDNVYKKEEIISMDVVIPKVSCNYKINYSRIENIDPRLINLYINIWFHSKFSNTSDIVEVLKNNEVITDNLELSSNITDTHILFMIMADVLNENEFRKYIQNEMKHVDVSEEEFNRKKKVIISGYVSSVDDIFMTNERFMEDIALYNQIFTNDLETLKNINYEEFKKVIASIKFDNNNIVIIKPKA